MTTKLPTIISLLLSIFLIAPIAYMLNDNQPPYEYDAENSYIIPQKAQGGNQMLVHWAFTRVNRVCGGTLTRFVIDEATGYRFSYDTVPVATHLEVGDKHLDRSFTLPQNIVPGWKNYYAEMNFVCPWNLLQRFYPLTVRTPRLRFKVVNGDSPQP